MLSVRELDAEDSIEALTELLHRAYSRLGEMGLNYTAVDQPQTVTTRRIAGGHCLVAELDGRVVGTITWYEPGRLSNCEYYKRPRVGVFSQFAVEPDLHGSGIGLALLAEVEKRARESGAIELACDTAAPAAHLVEWCGRRGYQPVGETRWPGKTYTSWILSRRLSSSTRPLTR